MEPSFIVVGLLIAALIYTEYSYKKHIKKMERIINDINALGYNIKDNLHLLCHIYSYKEKLPDVEDSFSIEELNKLEKMLLYRSLALSINSYSQISSFEYIKNRPLINVSLSKQQHILLEAAMKASTYYDKSAIHDIDTDTRNLLIEAVCKIRQGA